MMIDELVSFLVHQIKLIFFCFYFVLAQLEIWTWGYFFKMKSFSEPRNKSHWERKRIISPNLIKYFMPVRKYWKWSLVGLQNCTTENFIFSWKLQTFSKKNCYCKFIVKSYMTFASALSYYFYFLLNFEWTLFLNILYPFCGSNQIGQKNRFWNFYAPTQIYKHYNFSEEKNRNFQNQGIKKWSFE